MRRRSNLLPKPAKRSRPLAPLPQPTSEHVYRTVAGVDVPLRIWPSLKPGKRPWVFWIHGGGIMCVPRAGPSPSHSGGKGKTGRADMQVGPPLPTPPLGVASIQERGVSRRLHRLPHAPTRDIRRCRLGPSVCSGLAPIQSPLRHILPLTPIVRRHRRLYHRRRLGGGHPIGAHAFRTVPSASRRV